MAESEGSGAGTVLAVLAGVALVGGGVALALRRGKDLRMDIQAERAWWQERRTQKEAIRGRLVQKQRLQQARSQIVTLRGTLHQLAQGGEQYRGMDNALARLDADLEVDLRQHFFLQGGR
jgi:uncharacterized membrane protein YccC